MLDPESCTERGQHRPAKKGVGFFKRLAVGVLRRAAPFPDTLWNAFLSYRVGSTPPVVPEVDYVAEDSRTACRLHLSELPLQSAESLRIVIVADTHERHRQVTLPAGDLLLHCGDILMSSSLAKQHRGERALGDFNDWLQAAPCKEKVVVGGNHDAALERLGSAAQEVLSAARLLQDNCTELPLAGLRVYGNAFSEGTSHNRAWQLDSPEVSDACNGADIIVTHECCPKLEAAVLARTKPLLWASGHRHAAHGARWHEGTLYVNAAIQDKKYQPSQPPFVVDLPARRQ